MTTTVDLDEFDRKILRALQESADYSMADLGAHVGLSHTPCWRRLKRLEADGFIRGKVTLLDSKMLNLNVTVHASVIVKDRDAASCEKFEHSIMAIPEVVECYSTTGERDYLLKIIVSSVQDYEKLLRKTLAELPNLASIQSVFALNQIKYSTQLPL